MDGGYLIIQYWFLYAMNDWRSSFSGVNDHEADWEQITVYLAPSGDQPGEDEWCQPKRPWRFELAPDELHKANVSGGTNDLLLPTIDADPVIAGVNGRPGVTLVTYLRVSLLGFGGFPGLQFESATPPLITDLTRDLIPF